MRVFSTFGLPSAQPFSLLNRYSTTAACKQVVQTFEIQCLFNTFKNFREPCLLSKYLEFTVYYLLVCDPTTCAFASHCNLRFVLKPVAMEPSLSHRKVLNIVRCEHYFSAFTCQIEHVPGSLNFCPDIVTRWMRGYRKNTSICYTAPSFLNSSFAQALEDQSSSALTLPKSELYKTSKIPRPQAT